VPERRGALFSFFQDERTPKCVADGGSAVALSTGTTPPSGNPGKFVVHKEVDGRYAVIGISRKDETGKDESVNAPLETPISITRQQRDATATLQLIVDTLSARTGVKVKLGTIGLSSDPLHDLEPAIGGTTFRRLTSSA